MVDAPASAPKFSALPHSIIRDTRLSRDARLLYAVLQSHWWQGTESYASHAEMAAEMGCSLSGIRRYLDELIEAGLIAEGLAGSRREKVYIRLPIRQNDGIEGEVNAAPVEDCQTFNTSKPEVQYVKTDTSNTSKTTYSYKKTPVKKTPEEDLPPTGVVAADAADPARPKPSASKRRTWKPQAEGAATSCPETIELNETSFETASKWGFTRDGVLFQLDKFLSTAKSNGRLYVDWKAAFRTWLMNEVGFAKRDGRAVRNGPQSGRPLTGAPTPSPETAAMSPEEF